MENEEKEMDYKTAIYLLLDKIDEKTYLKKIYSFIKAFV